MIGIVSEVKPTSVNASMMPLANLSTQQHILDFYQHFTRSDARFYNRSAFRTFHLYIIALFSLHQLMPAFRTIYVFHLSHFLSIRFLLLTKHLTPIFSLRLICSRILHWSFLLIFPIVCLKIRTYVRFFFIIPLSFYFVKKIWIIFP